MARRRGSTGRRLCLSGRSVGTRPYPWPAGAGNPVPRVAVAEEIRLSKWDDEYAAHAVWTTVDQCRATLEQCPQTDDLAQSDQVDRLRRLLIEVDARREVDGMMVPRPVLDTLQQAISNINGH